eukprot:COSAG02_NODE_18601_length_930_cov_0.983153_1_plen_153_part_00
MQVVRLSQLPTEEAADLFATAAGACAAAECEGGCDGFNWSMKDSWSLTGSGPDQLHLHVVPRAEKTDPTMFCRNFLENDSVYEKIDAWHPEPGAATTPPAKEWPDDATRASRTSEDMAAEAMGYREVQEGGCADLASFTTYQCSREIHPTQN